MCHRYHPRMTGSFATESWYVRTVARSTANGGQPLREENVVPEENSSQADGVWKTRLGYPCTSRAARGIVPRRTDLRSGQRIRGRGTYLSLCNRECPNDVSQMHGAPLVATRRLRPLLSEDWGARGNGSGWLARDEKLDRPVDLSSAEACYWTRGTRRLKRRRGAPLSPIAHRAHPRFVR